MLISQAQLAGKISCSPFLKNRSIIDSGATAYVGLEITMTMPGAIKALKGPLPRIKFAPTGGGNLETAADSIKAGASALGVGTALVDKKAVAEGRLDVITERAGQFTKIIKDARPG